MCKVVFLLPLLIPVAAQAGDVTVAIATEIGNIEVAVDTRHAPITAANFLRYVDAGFYNGGVFHRTVKADNQPNNQVKIEVIQAARAAGTKSFAAISLERTSVTSLSHRDGTISMARDGPDTAVSDFFICIGDQPSLDFGGKRNQDGQGFAAFGRVVRGMDIVRRIQAAPSDGKQHLTPPVRILRITRQ